MLHEWHEKNWERVTQRIKNSPLSAAFLFWGQRGLGQYDFAEHFADWLLCEQPQVKSACGQCASCQWLKSKTHPDKLVIQPEQDATSIKVDAIRQIKNFSQQTSHGGQYRVLLIAPAESMNLSAANALLKTLEEPPEKVIFLLVSYHAAWLLPTIRSRCQKIYFPTLNYDFPLTFSTANEKESIQEAYKILTKILDALEKKQLNAIDATEKIKALEKEKQISFETIIDLLLLDTHQSMIKNLSKTKDVLYGELLEIKKQLKMGININQTIWLENVFSKEV